MATYLYEVLSWLTLGRFHCTPWTRWVFKNRESLLGGNRGSSKRTLFFWHSFFKVEYCWFMKGFTEENILHQNKYHLDTSEQSHLELK